MTDRATKPKASIFDVTLGGDDDVLLPFLDETGSADMNVNVGFSGTPEIVHDGGDTTGWAASNLTGSNFSFTSTTHAKQAIATVVAFGSLSGDAVTINGTNITNTTLTEGVDWTAATSNAATATSLASAINGVSGVSASATGAVVTVIADDATIGADITTFTSTDGTNLPVSAQSIDASTTVNGDEALFTAPSPIDFDDFSTPTFNIFIIDWTSEGGAKEFQMRFRNAGVDVGNSVNISEFIETGTFDVWQSAAISKSMFGIIGQTVNQIVIKNVAEGAGNPPSVFFDIIQVEEQGTPVTFTLALPVGSTYDLKSLTFYGEKKGGISGANGFPEIDPEQFFFINELAIGFVNTVTIDGIVTEGGALRSNGDFVRENSVIESRMFQNNNGGFAHKFDFGEGARFIQSRGDSFTATVNDNLSTLSRVRFTATGDLSF